MTLCDADRQLCLSLKAKLHKVLSVVRIALFTYCSVFGQGVRNSDVMLWCHSLAASRQRTLPLMENMQAFIYHYVFTWTSPSSDFPDWVIFLNRLLCYMFFESITTFTRGFDSVIMFSFWFGTVIYLRVTVTCSTNFFGLFEYCTGWVFQCMLNAQVMMWHLKALSALMHVNQTWCPIMPLSWACMIKCIYSKLRYKDKMIHE